MVKFKIKQKIAIVFSLVIVLGAFSSATAFAYQNGTVTSSHLDVSLYGWVEFLRGPYPIVTPDKIWYNANASGSELWMVGNNPQVPYYCYVTGFSNARTLSPSYLSNSEKNATVSDAVVGIGAEANYGKLEMRCIYDYKTLVDY